MMIWIALFLSVISLACSKVVHIKSEDDFKRQVMNYGGVAMVEFYAPWCGHCKNLEPEYKKAAKILDGVVKLVAVDATVQESLARKYQIQGFPTLKMFGLDKNSPTDYQGGRTSDAIVSGCMKAANSLVKDRKAGKKGSGGSSSGGSGSSSSSSSSSGSGSKRKTKPDVSDVVQLDDSNFNDLVMNSNDHWMVEFYAPWCGHCKNLAPEWEEAAHKLAGSVKMGAVDATVAQSIASKYGIQGYPTIKLFPAGKKGPPKDYNGKREAADITEYALQTLEEAGVPISTPQIVGKKNFESDCTSSKLCVIMFMPHILDSGAKERNKMIEFFAEVAKTLRGTPASYVWSEAGAQPELESALEVNMNYPSLAVLSAEKGVFAIQRSSWSKKNCQTFLKGVLSGAGTSKLASVPTVNSVKRWDGKDAEAPKEEFSLEELMAD